MDLIKDINDTTRQAEADAAVKIADAAEIEALAIATAGETGNGKSIADYMADIASRAIDK